VSEESDMDGDILRRIERLEAAILGLDGRGGLVADVAAIRVLLDRLVTCQDATEAAISEHPGRYVARVECDRRHGEQAAWARVLVPAIVGAGLAMIVSLLMRGVT